MTAPGDDDSASGNGSPDVDGRSHEPSAPAPEPAAESTDGPTGWTLVAHDIVSSVLAVAVVGGYLFMISGVWPPMVAVESPSMVPNMETNDLVFVMDNDRFEGDGAVNETGVVTARTGERSGYESFDESGDVIVFAPDGQEDVTPIIHRAMFWVNESENWYDKADPEYVDGADNCAELNHCRPDHAGFITKGDNNNAYDQVHGISDPVRPSWIVGTAEFRVPGLGWIRLQS